MSLLSLAPPAYAETHFKFKLPWSLLYRKRPEIIVDAPSQINANQSPEFWIVVRDADRFPLTIESIQLKVCSSSGEAFSVLRPLNILANKAFGFYPVSLGKLTPGDYEITPYVKTVQKKRVKTWYRWNYPFLKGAPLRIQVLSEKYFVPVNYAAGEMHCHTYYSSDQVEFGAAPEVLQSAAKAIGLDFVLCTDHAYDFAFSEEDYTKPCDPKKRFEKLKKEIEKLPSTPLLIAGEEISVGNVKGENVHMLSLAPVKYVAGDGDCGRHGFNNQPTWTIKEAVEQAEAPCFAAHPKTPISALERFVFRRGNWQSEDLLLNSKSPIRGIQFWNGSRDRGFELGRKWWIEQLEKGHRLLPIGGNDAHGDLNCFTGITLPLISLRHHRDHIFGKVKTVVALTGKKCLTLASLKKAFTGDNLYLTDGPALWWTREKDFISFEAKSMLDFGEIKSIKIYAASKELPSIEKICDAYSNENVGTYSLTTKVPIKEYHYIRAECETKKGLFALTSAAFTKATPSS